MLVAVGYGARVLGELVAQRGRIGRQPLGFRLRRGKGVLPHLLGGDAGGTFIFKLATQSGVLDASGGVRGFELRHAMAELVIERRQAVELGVRGLQLGGAGIACDDGAAQLAFKRD